MKANFHRNLTYHLALAADWRQEDASLLAWTCGHADDSNVETYGIQTQCSDYRAIDPQIQGTVIVPFHFAPSLDSDWPWGVKAGVYWPGPPLFQGDILLFGIQLHCYQDTWAHQGFSGWREERNSVVGFIVPNIGHAELGDMPDLIDRTWFDNRTAQTVCNLDRFSEAAKATWKSLSDAPFPCTDIRAWMRDGFPVRDFRAYQRNFDLAARAHLSQMLEVMG